METLLSGGKGWRGHWRFGGRHFGLGVVRVSFGRRKLGFGRWMGQFGCREHRFGRANHSFGRRESEFGRSHGPFGGRIIFFTTAEPVLPAGESLSPTSEA